MTKTFNHSSSEAGTVVGPERTGGEQDFWRDVLEDQDPEELPRRRILDLLPGATLQLGLALVVGAALTAGVMTVIQPGKQAVFAISAPIPYGATITEDMLTPVKIPRDEALKPILVSDRANVLGKRAAVELRSGTLLTWGSLTNEVIPAPGQQLVGIGLKASQMPAGGLTPGQKVVIVSTPAYSGSTEKLPAPIPATVAGVGTESIGGTTVVDMAVSSNDGATLASRAATGYIAVVVQPRR
jgi:hypothetical protein